MIITILQFLILLVVVVAWELVTTTLVVRLLDKFSGWFVKYVDKTTDAKIAKMARVDKVDNRSA